MRELEECSGLSRNAISDLENHNVNARPSTVRKLADALGMEPRELIESANEPNHGRLSDLAESSHVMKEGCSWSRRPPPKPST